MLKSFTTRCYKIILGINNDVEKVENDLSKMLESDNIEDIMEEKKNKCIYSHIKTSIRKSCKNCIIWKKDISDPWLQKKIL